MSQKQESRMKRPSKALSKIDRIIAILFLELRIGVKKCCTSNERHRENLLDGIDRLFPAKSCKETKETKAAGKIGTLPAASLSVLI